VGLGINKALEPLVREVRRAGGTVEVTGSNHVRWVMPDGSVKRTGLTMNSGSARNAERELRAALAASTVPGVATTAAAPSWVCEPNGRGKFHLIGPDGGPMLNASGFARTFSSQDEAIRTAESDAG
jgi:hypothetical protein